MAKTTKKKKKSKAKKTPRPKGKPWYHNGLQFECTGCGGCCTGEPGHVWVNSEEIDAMAEHVGVDREDFEDRYTKKVGARRSLIEFSNGDCVFFDSEKRGCTVYDIRPQQYRTWPFWPINLSSPEEWVDIAVGCPGCNQGRLYTLEEIEEQAGILDV